MLDFLNFELSNLTLFTRIWITFHAFILDFTHLPFVYKIYMESCVGPLGVAVEKGKEKKIGKSPRGKEDTEQMKY